MNDITLRLAEKKDARLIHSFLKKLAVQLGCPESFKGTVAALETFGFGPRPAFEAILVYHQRTAVSCMMNNAQIILLSVMVGSIVPVAYSASKSHFETQGLHLFVVTADQP